MPGFYDDDTSRFVSNRSMGNEYELEEYEKKAIADIKKRLKEHKFRDRLDVLESIEFLENLNQKISETLRNEESAGNDNCTLKVARDEIVELFQQLKAEYKRLE